MGRKAKFSKEVKVAACEKYKHGLGSFASIAKEIGCSYSCLKGWYDAYINHGESIFNESHQNKKYNADFKKIVAMDCNNTSITQVAAKYGIKYSVVRCWYNNYFNGIVNKSYKPNGDIYTMKSRETTIDEKLDIINYVLANDNDYGGAAKKYNVPYANVYAWVKKYLERGEEGLNDKRGRPSKDKKAQEILSPEEQQNAEIEKLQKELKRKDMIIEVLKKNIEIQEKLENSSRLLNFKTNTKR